MEHAYLLNLALDQDPGDTLYSTLVELTPVSARQLLRYMQIVETVCVEDPLVRALIVEDHLLECFEPDMEDDTTAALIEEVLVTAIVPLRTVRPDQQRTHLLTRPECVATATEVYWQGYTPGTAIRIRTAALSRTMIDQIASSAADSAVMSAHDHSDQR